jgi:HSP20 family protein
MNQLRSFNSLNNLQRELSRVFDSRYPFESTQTTDYDWQPHVDITETETAYKVHAEIPGVSPQDVDVTLHNGILTVKGEKTTTHEHEEGETKHRERTYGSFSRQFSLPETTDEDGVKAKAVNGVLEIEIPKVRAKQPLNINVTSSD